MRTKKPSLLLKNGKGEGFCAKDPRSREGTGARAFKGVNGKKSGYSLIF
jgi:hypothetical protein